MFHNQISKGENHQCSLFFNVLKPKQDVTSFIFRSCLCALSGYLWLVVLVVMIIITKHGNKYVPELRARYFLSACSVLGLALFLVFYLNLLYLKQTKKQTDAIFFPHDVFFWFGFITKKRNQPNASFWKIFLKRKKITLDVCSSLHVLSTNQLTSVFSSILSDTSRTFWLLIFKDAN